jgi:hypothetical protein
MKRLGHGFAVLAVGVGVCLAWSAPAQAATVDVKVTCAVGSGQHQLVRLPSHVQTGDTLQVTYQGCQWFRVITDQGQRDAVTPVGTGFTPSPYSGFVLAGPSGTLTFTVNLTLLPEQALLNFLPQDAMVSTADDVYVLQVNGPSSIPTVTPSATPSAKKPVRRGGYDTVAKPNGINARYTVTALAATRPAVLRVKVGNSWSPYRLTHPGLGQTVVLDVFKAVNAYFHANIGGGCDWEGCPVQVWAYRPGTKPVLVYARHWSPEDAPVKPAP